MESNVYEYLKKVGETRYYGNLKKINQGLSLHRLLNRKKQKLNFVSKNGFEILEILIDEE